MLKRYASTFFESIGALLDTEAQRVMDGRLAANPYAGTGAKAAETLAHELIHAAGCKGHKGAFVEVAAKLGFEKPWKSTPASAMLTALLARLCEPLGDYPHATLDSIAKEPADSDKPQTTRMLKCECEECGYTVRAAKKWIVGGTPICPCNMKPMSAPDAEPDAE